MTANRHGFIVCRGPYMPLMTASALAMRITSFNQHQRATFSENARKKKILKKFLNEFSSVYGLK